MLSTLADEYSFKAFVSYSNKDVAWAKWLVNALETYPLPADVKERLGRPRGVGRIFRDRDEAAAATDLKEEIERALADSENFIVIASPHSARSRYVAMEIEAFALANAARSVRGKILTLIVAGEPNVPSPDGTLAASECLPLALRSEGAEPDSISMEPLAADARSIGDGKTRALAKIVAGLLDIRYDTLVRRDLRRQRRGRLIAGVAAIAAVVVAGLVTATIVSGLREQARLRLAGEAADLSFRTVSAVNNAESARRLLARGNLADATSMARESLPNDGSLPFVPQAYDVLYNGLFPSYEPLSLDLGSSGVHEVQTFELASGDFLSVDGVGKASLWSPDKGIIFVRDDLDPGETTTVSPDRTAVFVQPISSMLRYSVDGERWDVIDPLGFDFFSPDLPDEWSPDVASYVAVDAKTLAGCGGPVLLMLGLSDVDGTSSLLWFHKFESDSCDVLEVTPQHSLMIADGDGTVSEFDLDERIILQKYNNAGPFIEWSRSVGSVVLVGGISETHVFDRESGDEILFIDDSVGPKHVSDGGRYLFEPEDYTEDKGIVLHDLVRRTTRPISCEFCSFVGFVDETTMLLLASDGQQVLAFDTSTGQIATDTIFNFPVSVDRSEVFGASGTLLGLRDGSPEFVARIGATKVDATLVKGDASNLLVSAIFAGPESIVAQMTDLNYSMKTTLYMYRVCDGTRIIRPELDVPTGLSELERLPHGLFASMTGEALQEGGHYRLFDSATGALVFEHYVSIQPIPFGGGRYLLLSDETDFGVFDLVLRTFAQLSAGHGAAKGEAWSANGGILAVATGTTIRSFALSEDGAKPATTVALETPPLNICVSPHGSWVYTVSYASESPILDRISLENGSRDARVVVDYAGPRGEDLARVLTDTAIPGFQRIPDLACDDERLVIRDEMANLAAEWLPLSEPPAMAVKPLAEVLPPVLSPVDEGSRRNLTREDWGRVKFTYGDAQISLIDPLTLRPELTIRPEGSRISRALWVSSRGLAAAGLDNGRLQVWDTVTPSALMIDLLAHGQPVQALDVSVDDKLILSADASGNIKLWPLLTTAELLKATEAQP